MKYHTLIRWMACVSASMLLGCGASLPTYYGRLDYRTETDIPLVSGQATTQAFYVTNRLKAPGGGIEAFLPRRSEKLSYGTCLITVPYRHNIGSDIITEQLSRASGRPQPEHLQVREVTPADDAATFFSALNTAIDRTPGKDVVILVHGYRNSFSGPVARTAELVYDLGHPMVPIAFSWVSQDTLQGYFEDENNIDNAARQLATFLEQLRDAAPQARIHLIAHSMGSRVTSAALIKMKSERQFSEKPLVDLIFAAADIDAAEFRARADADGMAQLAQRTTLYCCYSDRALQVSEQIHGRTYSRAGQAGENIVVMPGVDTIDVSLNDASLVGHGYYGDNRAVIQDLYMLMVLGLSPERRNLYHVDTSAGRHWLIRP